MAAPLSKRSLRIGGILTGVVVAFLVFDIAGHLIVPEPVKTAMEDIGWPAELTVVIGVIELACLAIYLVPRTSILGAVLLTGYLGGAVASNLRAGMPLATHVLFPVYLGALLWGGLWLRDARVRTQLPFVEPKQAVA